MKTKAQHERDILKVIKEHKVKFIAHIFAWYKDISRQQFYNLGLDKFDTIKGAIEENRTKECSLLIDKWLKSDNATLEIAAYRLLCTDDEHRRLNQQYIDHTAEISGKEGNDIMIKVIDSKGEQRG